MRPRRAVLIASACGLIAAATARAQRPAAIHAPTPAEARPAEPETPGESAQALKKLMWQRWDARRFAAAEQVARRVLALAPGDPEAEAVIRDAGLAAAAQDGPGLRGKAAEAWRAGRKAESITLLRRALALRPDDYLSLRDLMWALWRSDDIPGSLSIARRVFALKPDDRDAAELTRVGPALLEARAAAARYEHAKQLIAAGGPADLAAAVEQLRALVAADPLRWEYRRQFVVALRMTGHESEALDEAGRLATDFPNNPDALAPLGLLQARLGMLGAARETLEKALALRKDQPRVELALGAVYLHGRDLAAAETRLRPLLSCPDPDIAVAVPWPLAQALFWEGRYAEALPLFDRAIARDGNKDARYYRGWTLLRLDRVAEGRAELEPLMSRDYPKAFNLLFADAMARGDVERAIALGRRWLETMTPADEGLALWLYEIMRDSGRLADADALLDRITAVVPLSQEAWLGKTAQALLEGRLGAARRFALKARDINPAVMDWREKLRGIASASGDNKEAYELALQLQSFDPTDPRSFLRAVGALYDLGRHAEARRQLAAWVARAQPVLPILLFHGLANSDTDPMLAYDIHESTRAFDDQLRALAAAGYKTVTTREAADWFRRGKPLPPKPVLITFDDARADSFELGTPILARYGFKASMMAALTNVESSPHSPGYATWDMVAAYAATGQWEIQAHGDLAHIKIPMDAAGRQGLFLVNRRWEAKNGRLETISEWRARIDGDYASCRRKIAEHIGSAPIAFAFPEGAAGQKGDPSNTPEALRANRAFVSKYYELAYVQDDYGVNTRDRDPYDLVRFEPGKMSGKELVKHFVDGSPKALADVVLIDWALVEKRFGEARGVLDELRAMAASEKLLASEDASIRYYAGDLDGAAASARRALQSGPDLPVQALARRVDAEQRPAWRPAYEYYDDNESRRTWTLTQTLESPQWGLARARASYQRAEFLQGDSVFVGDNSAGAGLDLRIADGQKLSADVAEHLLSGPRADFFSATGEWDAAWPGSVETWARGSRSLLYSAPAVAAGVWRRGADVGARWAPDAPWSLAGRAQRDWYSDANTRSTIQAEAGRDVASIDRLLVRGLYRYVYDYSPRRSALYYAPNYLTLHGIGPELVLRLTRDTRLQGRYLASRGAEHGVPPQFVSEARAALSTRWREADALELSYEYERTPTFRSQTVSAAAAIRF